MIVGGYDLHLYCFYEDCVESKYSKGVFEQMQRQYPGVNRQDSYTQARRDQWHFIAGSSPRECVCYYCWKKGRRGPKSRRLSKKR